MAQNKDVIPIVAGVAVVAGTLWFLLKPKTELPPPSGPQLTVIGSPTIS